MKKVLLLLALWLSTTVNIFAENTISKKVATDVKSDKYLSSSILLCVRTDTLRKAVMERGKGPHSQIIAASKGLYECRQIHLSEQNSGLWFPINGVETVMPTGRKMDGIADVALKNLFSIFRSKKQNRVAYKDEVNIFKRTILYAAFPKKSRWYNLTELNKKNDPRSIVFFRKKEGESDADFKRNIMEELWPELTNTGLLKELRSKYYNVWKQNQWDSPNVLHDNDKNVQFQASMTLGFADKATIEKFLLNPAVKALSDRILIFCSASHAYEIEETLTFVKDGKQLTQYQK